MIRRGNGLTPAWTKINRISAEPVTGLSRLTQESDNYGTFLGLLSEHSYF
jgi:hypothetical protein